MEASFTYALLFLQFLQYMQMWYRKKLSSIAIIIS